MTRISPLPYLLVGALLGATALAALRFALVPTPAPPHFHANLALFAGGKRIDLSARRYMEDVTICVASGTVLPRARVHLHDQVADVVHVHDEGVTWGHLLINLGFGLGDAYLATDDGTIYTAGGGGTLKFVLNGRPRSSVRNELIRSGDRLLISYGPESASEVLRTQFPRVASSAGAYNRRQDPAGCAGAARATLGERLRHALAG